MRGTEEYRVEKVREHRSLAESTYRSRWRKFHKIANESFDDELSADVDFEPILDSAQYVPKANRPVIEDMYQIDQITG